MPFLSRLRAALSAYKEYPGAGRRSSTLDPGYGLGARWDAGGTWQWGGATPSSGLNWERMAGDLWRNSAVAVCVSWARRNFPQASPVVRAKYSEEIIGEHPLTALLYRPNPYYSGRTLWAGTLLSWIIDGNAYWLKVRDGAGVVRQLWYLPHFQTWPFLEADGVTVGYAYRPDSSREARKLPARDVVHLRNGLDPDNTLRGLSDLRALLREVATDNEAAVYDASILRNMGVPGAVISPTGETDIDRDGADAIKAAWRERVTGDQRGMPIVTPMAVSVSALGLSPEQLALDRIRRVPEARICGAIGIPAMVVGLSVGEDQRTYANLREAREAAAEEFLIPTYTSIADDLDTQLLGIYDPAAAAAYIPELGDPAAERFDFDTDDLRMLSEDVNATALRWGRLYRDGIAMRGEAREAVGLGDRGEEDAVFFAEANAASSVEGDADNDGMTGDSMLPLSQNPDRMMATSRNGAG